MKKAVLAQGLLSAVVSVGLAGFASADTAWIEYGGTYDGLWTDVNHWFNGGVNDAIPGWARLQDTAPVDTATISFPTGEPVVNKMTAIYFAAGSGKRLVLSGEGADFQMPDLEPTKHPRHPLQFAPHISLDNFCIESDPATGSLGRFTNFHFTVDASVPKTGKVLFEGGYYRFDKRMSVLGDNTVSPTNIIVFKDCTLAFDGGFNLQSATPYGRFVLDNVQASSAPGEMTKGYGVGQADGQVTLTDFLLTNGTEFHYDEGTFAFGQGSYPRAANFHRGKVLHLTIEKGSAFYLKELENGAGARMVIDILKDSKLCIMDGAFAPGRGAHSNYTPDWSTGIVNVVSGQLTVRNYSWVDQLGSSEQVDTWGELNVSDGGIAEFYRSQSSETTKWAHDLSCPRGQISVCRSGEIVGGKIIGSSPSRFVSDGGIVRWSGYASDDANKRKNAFEGFGEARIGKGGLLYDSGSTAVETTVAQSFSNLGPDSGTLTCRGLIKLAGQETDVGTIAVAGGSLGFAAGATPDSSVIVTNGASLRLANLVSLKALTLGDANSAGKIVLSVSASDPIALPQAPALVNPVVTAESALAAGTYTPFVCATPISSAEKHQWERLVMAPDYVAAGKVADFQAVDANGCTELRVIVRDAAPMGIVVADGETSNVTWRVHTAPADTLTVSVGEEAAVTMSGEVGDGKLVKEGSGALYLSGLDNYFAFGYTLLGGLLSVDNGGALGFADNGSVAVLKDGTLAFTGSEPIREMTPFTVDCATRYGAVAVKADCDVTMPLPQIKLGNFIKRGAGRLTFETDVDKTLNLAGNQGHCTARAAPPYSGMPVVFDEEYGNVPYSEAETSSAVYTPLTIAEGELRLLGIGETVPKVNYYAGGVYVGIATTCGTVPPQLTIDHVYANFQGGHSFEMSCGYKDGFLDRTSSMVVTNGATFNLAGQQFLTLYQSAASALTTTVTVVDHSTFRADPTVGDKCDFNASFAKGGVNDGSSRYFFRDKSKFVVTANTVNCDGLVEFDFDDSTCEISSYFSLTKNAVGSLFSFRNGSVFKGTFGGIEQTLETPVLFANAEWQPGTGDIAVGGGTTPTMTIAVEDAGLVLAPAAGETWTLGTTVSGEGGIVNRGEGTLKLTAGNALFTGPLAAEAGVLDLDGGTFANRVITFGGSIENGTLDAPTIRVGLDVAGIVEHPIKLDESDGLALTGRVSVDLGRTADDPIVLPMEAFEIGTYVGAAPDVSGWKLVGTGVDRCRGKFAVQSGKITVKPYVGGLTIIVR